MRDAMLLVGLAAYVIFLVWAYYMTFFNPCTMPMWSGDRPLYCHSAEGANPRGNHDQ